MTTREIKAKDKGKKALSMPLAPEQPGNQQPFDYPPHPFANIFPRLPHDELKDLADDIAENGLGEAIMLFEKQVLDGRNRLAACMMANVRPRFIIFDGTEAQALARVISKNLKRRHLTEGQRAIVANRIAMLPRGRRSSAPETAKNKPANLPIYSAGSPSAASSSGSARESNAASSRAEPDNSADGPAASHGVPAADSGQGPAADTGSDPAVTQAEAAKLMHVSPRSIRTAGRLTRMGVPELVEKVEAGELSLNAAGAIAAAPKEEQAGIVARGKTEILARAKEIRAGQQRDKRARRVAEIEKRTVAAGPVGRRTEGQRQTYNVIYCDPPWRFESRSRETGLDRAADNHYPTMTVDEIARLRPPAAADAALFLWVTVPHLKSGLELINQWGFTYRSHLVWVKDRTGKGYWARNRHELLLIATRGNIPAPEPGTQPASVIEAPLGRHSEKPARFAEIIEAIYPSLPKLEMYARQPREGWDAWGNEVPVEGFGSAQPETAQDQVSPDARSPCAEPKGSRDAPSEGSGRAPDGSGSAQPEPAEDDEPELPAFLRRAPAEESS